MSIVSPISCNRKLFASSLFGSCLILIPFLGHAGSSNSVTLQWTPNTDSDLAGYNVYHGTKSGVYGTPINAGKKTEYQFSNLQSDQTYYFAVTAFDTSGNESEPSIEVSKAFDGSNTNSQSEDENLLTIPSEQSFPPAVTSPVPGTTLTSTTITFKGAYTGEGYQHWAYVGSTAGGSNYYAGAVDGARGITVSGLPTNGTIYVRYFTRKNGTSAWEFQAHTYTMKVSSGSTGLTGNFPPPLVFPVPGSTLTSTSVTFKGAYTGEGYQHWAYVGSTAGGSNYYAGAVDGARGITVSGLPTNGTIYVRYFTRKNGTSAWEFQAHTYTMKVSSGSTGLTGNFPPPLVFPVPGSTLTSTSVTFKGAYTGEGYQHWAYVGSTAGGSNYYAGAVDGARGITVSGLPTNGTIYVRYFTRKNGTSAWEFQAHTYTMKAR